MMKGMKEIKNPNRQFTKEVYCPLCKKTHKKLVVVEVYEELEKYTTIRMNGMLYVACSKCEIVY